MDRGRLALVLVALTFACMTWAQGGPQPVLPPGEAPPATPLSRLEAAGDADKHKGFDYVIVHEQVVTRVDERGVAETETTVLYKVLTAKGCPALSALSWRFDPRSGEVRVADAAILRKGEWLPVPAESALEAPAPQAAIYWGDRILALQLPRLEVGDGVQVRTVRKGFTYALLADGATAEDRFVPPMPGEYFDVVLFAADVPILEKRYALVLPAGKKLQSRVYNGALFASTSYTDTESTFSWWGFDLPATPDEPRQPDSSDIAPKVVLATVASWEAKSRWFFEVNDSQFASSEAIDTKVREILETAGVADGSDDAKARALLHWVAQNIRYSGQTMGQGEGYTLHPGTMIFEQRSGVCKDIAGMLVTMLRAAGIPTNPAMTMAGSRIEDVPADQFNHCVVARRVGDGYVMYDPTWVPYNNDIWSKLETEQHYLVGSDEGETLTRIPYSPPAESPLVVRHRARLAVDGALAGTVRFEARGASDGRLRRVVYGAARPELSTHLAGLLEPLSAGVEVTAFRHRAAEDFSGDMWLEIDYRAPGFAVPVDDGLEMASPILPVLLGDRNLFGAGATKWKPERTTDLLLYTTQLVDLEETIELPAGVAVAHRPPDRDVASTYASFEGHASVEGSRLLLVARAEVRRRQIPPDGYAGFRDAIEAAREWSRALIRVAPVGGAS